MFGLVLLGIKMGCLGGGYGCVGETCQLGYGKYMVLLFYMKAMTSLSRSGLSSPLFLASSTTLSILSA